MFLELDREYWLRTNDFHWEYTDQPHATRRQLILKRHPEIRNLMKSRGDLRTAVVGFILAISLIALALIGQLYLYRYQRILLMISVGTWFSSWIFLSMHEAAHGLVFGPNHPKLNRAYAITVNCAMGLPFYAFFRKYHKMHHRYQGQSDVEVEYPTLLEASIFNNHWITRFLWLQLNAVIQHIRAMLWTFPRDISLDHNYKEMLINYTVVYGFDALLVWFGYKDLVLQLVLSAVLAGGFNMVGVWLIITHTVWFPKEDTTSYYGVMNHISLNFGYHMEHHDFPNIPARLLPKIREIAPEFYKNHHYLDRFYSPMFAFLFDSRFGLNARIKREVVK